MSKSPLVQMLDCWPDSQECAPDSSFLIRFLTDGDEEAFTSLVRRHGTLVYGTCRRILGNRADADDAFQAVFFVLARRAHTLKLDRSIGPWLYGVSLRVARKLRGQMLQRRVREMSAAKSEQVKPTDPQHDFWEIIDEELSRMSLAHREVLLLCDLSGQSHSQVAKSLGLAKGTITKRLAKARDQLAAGLKRRGITLGVGALSSLVPTPATALTAPFLQETSKLAAAFAVGGGVGSPTVQTLAEGVMRSLNVGFLNTWRFVGLFLLVITGGGLMLAGGPRDPKEKKVVNGKDDAKPELTKVATMWKENYAVEYTGRLPVSVAFSADGKTLLTGDTSGEVMALIFVHDDPNYRWKAGVGGSHAAVAYSADQKKVYVTTKDGVRILDAASGKKEDLLEEKGSNPTAIGVFPDRTVAGTFTQSQIVFGNTRGYFVKSWAAGKLPDTVGTITTSTVAKGAKPADDVGVPLAVDPKGSSAIMTGPIDATGKVAGAKDKNVLWAYVCGNYEKGSPGNRVMIGHTATVVSAAWAKEGGTAVTGDADGRVIVWNAKTMKKVRQVELAGRIMALAISNDGKRTAAYVRGKQGGEVYVWDTEKPTNKMKPIHTEIADFGNESIANLAFSPDGNRLAGCASDKKWLTNLGDLVGKVRIWDFTFEPKDQPTPRHLYTKSLPKGSSANYVLLNNNSMVMPAAKEGAVDFRKPSDGGILFRLILGKFTLGGIKMSSDQKWLALEQHPPAKKEGTDVPARTFDVGVYNWMPRHKATIPSCSQLLDIASGGKVVAVVREKNIELWDIATKKLLKAAPFKHTRIDAAAFSPDGKLLAVSDRNNLVLWRWEKNTHERIDLMRCVGSLTFSPNGKYLAEGPTPGTNIQIRDLETLKIVQTLSTGTGQSMNVPRMVYTQGGRVLIACDNITLRKKVTVPHRIHLWDTKSGTIAHQIAVTDGLPSRIEVTPNGRYLTAILDDGKGGLMLNAWRLDGGKPATETKSPPASGPSK